MLISKVLNEALSDKDWRAVLVRDAHQHVDEMRKARGLKPYEWRDAMFLSEDYKRLMQKYKYIVDLDSVHFDGLKHEELRVEEVKVYAPKKICIKCGGVR